MPLREVEAIGTLEESLRTGKERFLVFFSSRLPETNVLWCPDCLAVDDLIRKTFSPEEAPSAILVYVGQRSEWKTPDNIFRKEPWKIEVIPTIVKLNEAGKDIGRLVDVNGQNSISDDSLPPFIR